MGGVAKGLLLAAEDEPIVVKTRRLLEEAGAECVLVGAHPAYEGLGLETIPDDPAAEGPLAGLLALLGRASSWRQSEARESSEPRWVIAVACDMPFIDRELVRRLVAAPAAPIVAPRRHAEERGRDVWEPLFARYDPVTMLDAAREYARTGGRQLQRLLDRAGARALELDPEHEALLADWDTLPLTPARASKKE